MPPKRKNKRKRTEEPEDKKESKSPDEPFLSHGKLVTDKCPSGTPIRYCHGRYFYTDPKASFKKGISDSETCVWCEEYGPRTEFQATAEPWQKFKEIERLMKRMKPDMQKQILWLVSEFAQDAHAQRCNPYLEPKHVKEFHVDFTVPEKAQPDDD